MPVFLYETGFLSFNLRYCENNVFFLLLLSIGVFFDGGFRY